ncbi:toluene tolerance protein [Campylobacter sp. LR264d]|uniref:Tgt2/MlaC family protein n=1 Tax=Campylobacter sp. LR264d TaxID=2593544 RepID=UPI001238524A|nr:ABC transporter substrate-binding protein [Campylobacter sp. LR264d]KAA6229841.1 toluene tolerance protein [Campylobacter sp. LR264d]
MKKILLFLSLSLALFGLELNNIESVMQTNIDKSLQILKQTQGDKKQAASTIFAIFDDIIDYKLMARLSLSKYYKNLDSTQQETYNKAFEESLKKSFTDKLSLYKDQTLKVKKGELKNEKRYFLTSAMVIDGEEKNVVFKFYKENNDWLIYDFDVLGISIVQTYRSQFGDILENENFNALLNKLNTIIIE